MTSTDDRREAAIKRLNDKREFRTHAVVFVAVNLMLVVIWAATGGGYFWPIWAIGGWGVGLLFHGYDAYSGPEQFSESQIEAEMRRQDQHTS